MKGILGFLCIALALFLAGAVFLGAGFLDRNTAHAEQSVNALKYDEADRTFATSERYLQTASHLPWIGNGPVNDIRTRRAAIRYWQHQYSSLISQQTDGGNGTGSDNVGFQLVAANAIYRAGQAQAKDKRTMLQAVDSGIQADVAILKNTARQDQAAYNLEYLARVRDEILNGPIIMIPPPTNDAYGAIGFLPLEDADSSNFKTLTPLNKEERQKEGDAGKAIPPKRRG